MHPALQRPKKSDKPERPAAAPTAPSTSELEETLQRLTAQHAAVKLRTTQLQQSAQLSEREAGHMENVLELQSDVHGFEVQRRQKRGELHQVEVSLSTLQHRCSHLRNLARKTSSELQNLKDAKMAAIAHKSVDGPSVAEWVEAEIRLRQVALVKERLERMMQSYTCRAEVRSIKKVNVERYYQ